MTASTANVDYLGDIQHRFLLHQQGWGALGINTCAYAPGTAPLPMRIGDKEYSKGLGHHAPGEIVVDLGGECEKFEAEVGVQKQTSDVGSVVFQVYVDDKKVFDSGVMRESTAVKSVSVSVKGADELRLVVTDAGDGITCDCANWANARLVRDPSAKPKAPEELLDIAPFARVTTSDPTRTDGCKSNRVQEFRAEDLFMEKDLHPTDGIYRIPKNAVVGLNWVEKRRLKEISMEFGSASEVPLAESVQLQFWTGESLWQGKWTPLETQVQKQEGKLTASIDWSKNPEASKGTRKIRWILPASSAGASIKNLTASTPTRTAVLSLSLQIEKPAAGARAEVEVYNGAIIEPSVKGKQMLWDMSKPLKMKVMYTKPKYWRPDRTVLMIRTPDGACAVGLDDLAEKECVYMKRLGLFAAKDSSRITLKDYRKQINRKKTVLERVREMPDQTFEQALAKTRNPAQSSGPMLLSLACDNNKFIVHKEGMIEFTDAPDQAAQMLYYPMKYNCRLQPRFGSGSIGGIERHLDGGWLPIPVSTIRDNGLIYTQKTYAAPAGQFDETGWLNDRPLCVAEFRIENPGSQTARAKLELAVTADVEKDVLAQLEDRDGKIAAVYDGRLLALIDGKDAESLKQDKTANAVVFTGSIPAGETCTICVLIPGWKATADDFEEAPVDAKHLRQEVEDYWNRVMAPAAQIEIPDEQLLNVIRANQVHCLIAARNEGRGERTAAWIAAMVYGPLESEAHSIIRGMDLLGHHEFAKRSLDFFIHRYNKEGFLTTGYTLMGTGWHLWTLGEHYELTKDANWLRGQAPEIARVCSWISNQCDKTKQLDGRGRPVPEYGLMPPGVMADWNAFAFYFCLNSHYYAGLNYAGRALAGIGYPGGESFVKRAESFKEDILRGYKWTQSRSPVYALQDGSWAAPYPSQLHCAGPTNDFFPGEDGNRSWAYDVELGAHQLVSAGVVDALSPEVDEMMDHMEDVQFLANGWFDYPAEKNHADWFNLGGFAKVQPYYCRNGEIYMLRDDVKPFIRSYFNALASLLNTETLWLWEHFNHSGAWDKTHETGYFLQQSRWMLVSEKDNELRLAPFVTNNWMKDGMTVGIKNAPTSFGPVSYRIKSSVAKGFIEAQIDPPARSKPDRIVIRLRHPEGKPMRKVTVNGVEHKDFDPVKEIVRVKPDDKAISVKAEY